MHKLCSELEMVASCFEAKRDKLKETKELYVTLLLHCTYYIIYCPSSGFMDAFQDWMKETIQRLYPLLYFVYSCENVMLVCLLLVS